MADNGHSHGDNAEYYALRAEAIQALLIEKGVCTMDDIMTMADKIDSRSPADGAKVLAHAWVDPGYKARLLADAESALLELGYDLPETAPKLTVLENTDDVHNMAVCTLCSCYPRAIIGRPPAWYKGLAYRSRVVVDPRGVLQEFGTELDEDVQVRVIDSSADYRYLVLPKRPAGTEGMSEEDLAKLITQESMIGVGLALTPEQVSAS
ncbi:MAG: nitrile hydratase subunit alpha [Dehalococcoidia bacterium]|nr:nitrile hydratase subunit alpha [Dehalococcoidia bacterium]|tara:strand:- start:118 stop:741 length:624 start_codon:yes stop_codon:yes gene_type:complete